MIIQGEIRSSYHHKPKVQGVDYSPLIMESDEEALVKEEIPPEATPAEFPPPILAGSGAVFVSVVFWRLSSR